MGQIERFIRGVEDITGLMDHTAKSCVAVLGSFNSGKSTLINGLLGTELSPVGVVPTTNCLISFDYGHAFSAKYTGAGQNLSFQHMDQLRSFLEDLKIPSGKVTVKHNCPLLKKCRLVDTPGIDGSHDAMLLALQSLKEADQVIYLFHQRGIEDLNRVFLYKLAGIWKNKDLNKLSFWLNCNHGSCDGSSLETTRSVLREIFMSRVRCNTLNTRNNASLEALRLFLQVELARDFCRRVSRQLKQLDYELPGRLLKAVKIKEEPIFLSEYWKVKETAQVLLESGHLLQSLPAVAVELEQTLSNANTANLNTRPKMEAGGLIHLPKTIRIAESKKLLLSLAADLLADDSIAGVLNQPAIDKIASEIRAERFTAAALGGFSTGKTTFFNALLKEDLLPTADGPTTTAVTRITYGPTKKATVHFPLQITLRLCEQVGEKIGIYREQLQALESWLAPEYDAVASVECAVGGHFQSLDRKEAQKRICQVKELFAAGNFASTTIESRIPAVFRLISRKAGKRNNFVDQARVTFKNAWSSEYDLSEQHGREQFIKVLSTDNAFRCDQVVVEYPSECLRHVDFLDTPGLDWIQKHHYEKTTGVIRQSDAYLVFLNGKHILNQMDQQSFRTLFLCEPEAGFQMLTTSERRKFFFVINYADVLNLAERETVLNFVRRKLGSPGGLYAPSQAGHQTFMISALKALSGDAGVMSTFLKALEEGIIKHRAKDFYLVKAADFLRILDEASLQVTEAYLGRNTTGSGKVRLRKAQETLRVYRRRIKEIRTSISPSKPP